MEQIRELKAAAMTGAAAKQENVELKKENAALRKDKTELQKKVPSIKDRMEAAAKQNQLERLQYENMELKEALEEERSFSDRLLEDIDRVLDMLERHLPRQLLHLVEGASAGASDIPAATAAGERPFLGRYEPVKIACPMGLANAFRTGYNDSRK